MSGDGVPDVDPGEQLGRFRCPESLFGYELEHRDQCCGQEYDPDVRVVQLLVEEEPDGADEGDREGAGAPDAERPVEERR